MVKQDISDQKPTGRKGKSLLHFGAIFLLLVLLNSASGLFFKRFDLTTDHRYSLNDFTKSQLANLEDIVFLRIYLDGELPAGFKQLQNSTKEILDEMRIYSGDKLQYEFIDPSENPDQKIRQNIYRELSTKGLNYTNLQSRDGDKVSEQIIFPGAILAYREKEFPIQLLRKSMGADPDVMLNNSIQQLEYEISSAIKKATLIHPKSIAFISGHGEAESPFLRDITKSLNEFYKVEEVFINGQLNALNGFSAIVMVGPDSVVSDKDKFIIDQFIMNGGKAMWFVENAQVNNDSLRKNGITMGLAVQNNLSDQLFKYGVRVNSDFIMDMQALPIPVVTGMVGDQPKQELFAWYYFPLIFSTENHPITANIDAVATQYASSIDTVGGKGIKKTPLLLSSKYTRVSNVPTRIALNILRDKPDERKLNKGPKMVGVLLEGEFESVFNGRIPDQIKNNPSINFQSKSVPNKMIVISDPNIIQNDLSPDKKEFMELGYYRFTQRVYGNKDFVLNAMSYLLEDDGLIFSRVKEFKLRLLNRQLVEKEKQKWQVINTALPIAIILLIGALIGYFRRRKFTSH